jgi:outer membrane protein OmpA-like peptidoglycan-associated protein
MDHLIIARPHDYQVEIYNLGKRTVIAPLGGEEAQLPAGVRSLIVTGGGQTAKGYVGAPLRGSVRTALSPQAADVDSIRLRRLPPYADPEGKLELSLAQQAIDESHLAAATTVNAALFETLDLRRVLEDLGVDPDSIKTRIVTADAQERPLATPTALEMGEYVLCYESRYRIDPGSWVGGTLTAILGTCTAFVVPVFTWGHLDLEVRLVDRHLTTVWTKKYSDSFTRMIWLPLLPLGKVHYIRDVKEHYRDVWRVALEDLASSGVPERSGAISDKGPDSDGDGVPDGRDEEPNTPSGAEVDRVGRARDDDGDGVANGIDRHSNTRPGTMVDQWGVPIDADHDGVADSWDRCPDTAANLAVDENGCPIVGTYYEILLVDEGRFQESIHFESGQSRLLPASFALLDSIGAGLSGLPGLRFEVGGHCDDRGSDEFNMQLSLKRAQAVVDYLVGHFPGVARAQLTARGFGRTRPITSGTDDASLAQNRRVEFVVLNPEALRQQVERKRYLLRGEQIPDSLRRGEPPAR